MTHPSQSFIPELTPHHTYVNARGETVGVTADLLNHPEHGATWNAWAHAVVPRDLFAEFGLLDAPDSSEWLNVVEHSMFVAAAAFTVGDQLAKSGKQVDMRLLVQAAIVHDATKRADVARQFTREEEIDDTLLEQALRARGYNQAIIDAAKNTGRSDDRFIEDPRDRRAAIEAKSLEANIVGYCDARTRNTHFFDLTEAARLSMRQKNRPEDMQFFTQHWLPYYEDVEFYLFDGVHGTSPEDINDDRIIGTVASFVETGSTQ